MRRRIAVLVTATMALVLVSFVVPLALLVRRTTADRAVSRAVEEAQSLSVLVATSDTATLRLGIERANAGTTFPLTVFLPDGTVVGAPAAVTPAVRLAGQGDSFSVAQPAGREIVVAVQGLPAGTAVIRTFVPDAELTRGVARAALLLALAGAGLLVVGVLVADRLAASLVRPIRDLARLSDRLATGELDARIAPSDIAEINAVGLALNHLAGQIRDLLDAERESAADLSHQLRTPLTALRLEAATLSDREETARIEDQIAELDHALTRVIENTRRSGGSGGVPAPGGEPADAAQVIAARAAFWAVLAEDQQRPMDVAVAPGPLPVDVPAATLTACADALLGNVFAHTPDGTPFSVRLSARDGGGALLVVADRGPGPGPLDGTRRGVSGAGSSGLGLDIARQAAAASGGTLTFERGESGGARVTVVLGPPAR
ncbi:HAMP domain-containing sensor histidine kinase [Jidongwangia harbinensis]|uniref:HAMP domain-containing sensor histidine kinase n=1 Tax=Jidongwangia harbinensis TaxID=2878561 RepID=UPI001CD9F9AD|nr:HAMP domain-containing sensor histidine kinase [Jidongwangia harbinensis]MCA2213379.1 HAMP domain-containing histidine kinase [Jidongwangia harbinensis]